MEERKPVPMQEGPVTLSKKRKTEIVNAIIAANEWYIESAGDRRNLRHILAETIEATLKEVNDARV
jgi:hypothetical protein